MKKSPEQRRSEFEVIPGNPLLEARHNAKELVKIASRESNREYTYFQLGSTEKFMQFQILEEDDMAMSKEPLKLFREAMISRYKCFSDNNTFVMQSPNAYMIQVYFDKE